MTPAQVLLGLSRRPLDAADEAAARCFVTPGATVGRTGLALLAARELRRRTSFPEAKTAADTDNPPNSSGRPAPHFATLPPRNPALATDDAVVGLLRAGLTPPLGLLPQVVTYLRQRGLSIPAAATMTMVQAIGTGDQASADGIALLGPRGAWLYEHYYSQGVKATNPETLADELRAAFGLEHRRFRKTFATVFARGLAACGPASAPAASVECRAAFGEIFPTSGWSLDLQYALHSMLIAGRLTALVSPSVLAKALYAAGGTLEPLDAYRLLAAAETPSYTEARSRAAVALAAREDQLQTSPLSVAPDDITSLAIACSLTGATAIAARLFESWSLAEDQLRSQHPALTLLLKALDRPTYGEVLQRFVDRSQTGWRDPRLPTWLAASPHSLGPEFSVELVEGQRRVAAYQTLPALLREAALKLDGDVLEILGRRDPRVSAVGVLAALEPIVRARESVDEILARGRASLAAP